jgi:ABC-2 type transport system ATP-binding protein
MQPPAISLKNLAHWYSDVIALNDISLDIDQKVVGLVGPNGAGKTTLLRLITGQLRPTSGRVTIGGQRVIGNHRIMSKVGYCPEHDFFYEHMTAHQFVSVMTRLFGFDWSESKQRAHRALAQVKLDEKTATTRAISTYSKGMRQKVKIAQALAHDPKILILDEPLTGIDALSRHHIATLICEYGVAGRTVLISSHVLHEVESVTQDFILINRGRLVAQGNIYEIRDLIDGHPHCIDVQCTNARALAAQLVTALPGDVGLQVVGEKMLIIKSAAPDQVYSTLPIAAQKSGVTLTRLSSADNNLEAVFRYLTQA